MAKAQRVRSLTLTARPPCWAAGMETDRESKRSPRRTSRIETDDAGTAAAAAARRRAAAPTRTTRETAAAAATTAETAAAIATTTITAAAAATTTQHHAKGMWLLDLPVDRSLRTRLSIGMPLHVTAETWVLIF